MVEFDGFVPLFGQFLGVNLDGTDVLVGDDVKLLLVWVFVVLGLEA